MKFLFNFLTAQFAFSTALTILEPSRGASTLPEAIYEHESLPGQTLRVRKTSERVCMGSEGIAGYVDIEEQDKHIFFWAFESRNDPENDPVILWMTGGPGGSSTGIGMMLELGPCLVVDKSTTRFNPYSWTNNATVLFVDQPANVGYSYSSNKVMNVSEATSDMYKFLQSLFLSFPHLAGRDFFIAGESFGGTWVPVLAAHIHERQSSPLSKLVQQTTPALPVHINLRGILLGNAQVAQGDQWKGFYDTGCTGPSKLFNDSACAVIQDAAGHCERLLEICNKSDYDFVLCQPLLQHCREKSVFFIQDTGLNPYDFRRKCEGESCYAIEEIAAEYMNSSVVKKDLGVEDSLGFQQVNSNFMNDFTLSGDVGRETAGQVSYLLNHDIDVLVYVGNKDWYCNAASMRYFVNGLVWKGLAGFRAESEQEWFSGHEVAGMFKQWTTLTFLELYDAGHMVPMDRPRESLDMINRWIREVQRKTIPEKYQE